jgi:hypothetical protein
MSGIDPHRNDRLHITSTVSTAPGNLTVRDCGTVVTLKVLTVLAQFTLQEHAFRNLTNKCLPVLVLLRCQILFPWKPAPPSEPHEVKSDGWYKQMNLSTGKNILYIHELVLRIPWSNCERSVSVSWANRERSWADRSVPWAYRELTVSLSWADRERTVSVS